MKVIVFTIYDKLARQAGPLATAVNLEVAQRGFNNLMREVPDDNKEDYNMVILGSFDDETLELEVKDVADFIEVNNG